MVTETRKPMAHRKPSPYTRSKEPSLDNNTLLDRLTYGVPSARRMLSPSLLVKKHDYIRSYLLSLGLTRADRDTVFFLLRLYAYYGKVYPKAPNYTEDCYTSKRSFWRAIAKLEDAGLVDRIHRYLNHLQISNAYRLDKLVLCIVHYLAEHGCPFLDSFTQNIIRQTANSFWGVVKTLRVRLRDPIPLSA